MKILILVTVLSVVYGRKGFGPGEQDWGYVTVRPGARTFWWLYETTANVSNPTELPLVIWLQGGPGGSSTGVGNFMELGPLDVNLNLRNHTWVKQANVLFIDNPVAAGYSYVDQASAVATTNKQIARDLVACLRGFYSEHPKFRKIPLYIAGESYGGKMAAEFALELWERIKARDFASNLLGIILLDPVVSSIDNVLNWAPYLYNMGIVDQQGYEKISEGANRVKAAVNAEDFKLAFTEFNRTDFIIIDVSKGADPFNVLKKMPASSEEDEKLDVLMNGPVKKALGLSVPWGGQAGLVLEALKGDFMKPVIYIVEKLLNETNIKVKVVTGQLDLTVTTPGTVQWVDRLKWEKSDKWKHVPRDALSVNGINEGYQKILSQFSFYWINRAGHMALMDNPITIGAILSTLLDN